MRKSKLEEYSTTIARLYPETIYQKKQTAHITFQITDNCNLKCSYCYEKNKGNHIMPISIAKKFIDMILQPNDNTKKYLDSLSSTACAIEFIGGEPLLQVKLMDEILDYFIEQTILLNHPWQYNWMVSISSNGTLYFNNDFQNFLNKYKDHLSFSISIDGNKQLHDKCRIFPDGSGSYDIAIKGVKHYKEYYKGIMGSKMTLSPDNIEFTKDAIINLIDLGYEDINLNCIFEKGWTNKHATILYYQLKELSNYLLKNDINDIYISMFNENLFKPKLLNDIQNWCGGNGEMIALDWKGDIYPCIRYMESSLGTDAPPIIIGNVNTGILTTQEQCIICDKLCSVNRITQSTEECLKCSIAEGCAWCQAYNYQDSGGDINHRATYICDMHKARSLANVYFWNLYYRIYNEPKRFKMWLSKEEALKIINEEEYNLLYNLQRIDI